MDIGMGVVRNPSWACGSTGHDSEVPSILISSRVHLKNHPPNIDIIDAEKPPFV